MCKYNYHSRHLVAMKVIDTCADKFDFLNIEVLRKRYEAQHVPIHQENHVPFHHLKKIISAALLLYFNTSQTRGKPGS